MKGLLVKDLRIMLLSKMYILFILGLSFVSMFMGHKDTVMTTSLIIIVLLAILATSTITYDDYDNGFGFLMTLPVSRNMYVLEKYLFSLIMALIGAGIGVVINIYVTRNVKEALVTIGIISIYSIIIQLINIPVLLKFGAEKGKLVIMIITILLTSASASIVSDGLKELLNNMIVKEIISWGKVQMILLIVVLVVLLYLSSIKVSMMIMKKKEF